MIAIRIGLLHIAYRYNLLYLDNLTLTNAPLGIVLTEENAQINIRFLKGEIVSQMKFNSTINLSVLQSGIYFLEIKTEKELLRKKIIKD